VISKKISLNKRKAPLSTQEVYTGTTQLAHIKTPRKSTGNYKPSTPKTHKRPKIQKKPPTNTINHPKYNRNPPANTQDTIEPP
jgi:hypothetical protein